MNDCKTFFYNILLLFLLMTITMWFAGDYNKCYWPYGWHRVAFVGVCMITRMAAQIPDTWPCLKILLLFCSLFNTLAWVVVAFVFYIGNLISTPSCIDLGTKIIDGFFISVIGSMVLFIFQIFFGVLYGVYREKKKKEEFANKLDQVYKNIYSSSFDAEAFIEKHKDVLDSTPLNHHELAILTDKFLYKFDQDTARQYIPEECIICLGGFSHGETMLDYPNCKHSYHFDCLSTWLKEKMICPLCKGTIRSSLIRAIVGGNSNQYLEDVVNVNRNIYNVDLDGQGGGRRVADVQREIQIADEEQNVLVNGSNGSNGNALGMDN